MPSQSIADLLNAYNLADWGIAPNSGDSGRQITDALRQIAAYDPANGVAFLPPGTYRVTTPVLVPSNIMLMGWGSASILQLGASANVDLIQSDGTHRIRVKDLRLDGNRANNTAGNGLGIWLNMVEDAWLDNVQVVGCRTDGIQLNGCVHVELKGCEASDNGRHGISLNDSTFCLLMACRCFDNSRVAAVGVGDAINLDVLSRDNTIIAPLCYETSLTGDRQGYGLREVSGGGCARNLVLGGAFRGNRTAAFLLEPDSLSVAYLNTQIPGGITTTP